MRLCCLTIALFLFTASTGLAKAPGWNLVWQDSFDRADLGSDWYTVSGRASIHGGRLLLEGGGATVLVDRPFKPDVRFEFDAEAMPGPPPCDLSAAIGANKDHGMTYLLAFGGQSNRVNQLLGPGVHQVDNKPPFLIERGKIYHIIAQEEGKRLTYTVNGTRILDAVTTDLAAGPGFDHIGLVTWNGMLVDNFRVYERSIPHPDTPVCPTALPETPIFRDKRQLRIRPGSDSPELSQAVDAFNKGDLTEALERFEAMGPSLVGLVGQAYVIADLAYHEKQQFHPGGKTEDFAKLARSFREAAKAAPSNTILAAYSRAADSMPHLIMERSGMTDAIRLVALGPENNPFYYKGRFYEARYHYWNGAEGGNRPIVEQAVRWMAELKKIWPENVVLRQYTGEAVPWGEDLNADISKHPAWAAYLREAYSRQVAIMDRFFTVRQSPDGQLGGGYGDDCELMRTWMQIAAISTATNGCRDGIRRLTDGIWDNELRDGFAKAVGDVEHSSEPSADTLPTMLLLNYGDPLYVERNMRSCKTIRNYYMGIDRKEYPRFKSSEFGGRTTNSGPAAGGDTGYSARAMKHFIWQAWWGNPEARDWFLRWCDGWRAAAMSTEDGKMAGFIPGSIWYPSGEIAPPNGKPWWDPKLNYYGCPGVSGMIMDSLLCAYYFSHDSKFLKPFQLCMDRATVGPLKSSNAPPPRADWQQDCMSHSADPQKISVYKWLTGERVYDEYTQRFGDPAQIYRADHDLDRYMKSFKHAAEGLRYDLELQTTEVLSTDRAALRSALTVFGAYTGAVCGLCDAATPTFAVTYVTPDTDFAALVTESTRKRLRVWLYSFHEKPIEVGLKLWQLKSGSYMLNQGVLMDGEIPSQHRYGWIEPRTVRVLHRADSVYVTVPGRKVWVVDLRLDSPIEVPGTAPDLAVGSRDLNWSSDSLVVTVHNIGNAASRPTTAVLRTAQGGGAWTVKGTATVPAIPAPNKYTPSTVTVTIPLKERIPRTLWKVAVDPDDRCYELCESNNIWPGGSPPGRHSGS